MPVGKLLFGWRWRIIKKILESETVFMRNSIRAILRTSGVVIVGVGALLLGKACGEIDKYPGKMWLHRCNSMEKLREKSASYPNVEVDLVFREDVGRFDVTHDEEVSFGLTVDAYFAYMEHTEGRLWLDVKNLGRENRAAMLAELERLVTTYHIGRERLIVESAAWEDLELFTQNGYYTSFYVFYAKPSELSRRELEDCVASLQQIADSRCVCALSFPGHWYRTIKRRLNRPIDLLTWKHRCTQLEILLTPEGRCMLDDEQLKVILVKDRGRYHR